MEMINERVSNFDGGLAQADSIASEELRHNVKEFLENGYVVIRGTDEFRELASIARRDYYDFRERNSSLCEPHRDAFGMLSRVVNLHSAIEGLRRLFSGGKAALDLMDYFLGETVVYTSLYFERGSNQDIHRDTPYFSTNPPMMYMGYWIALDDVDANNGPLRVVAGGHRLQELDKDEILRSVRQEMNGAFDPYSMDLWNEYQHRLALSCHAAGLSEREVHLKAGDAIVWHAQTPHGGAVTVNDAQTRNSVVFHVTPKNTPVGHQDVFYGKKPLPRIGSIEDSYTTLEGRLFKVQSGINFGHKQHHDLHELNCI